MKASFTCVNFSWDIQVKRQRVSMWRNPVLVTLKSWCLEGIIHSIYIIYIQYIPLSASKGVMSKKEGSSEPSRDLGSTKHWAVSILWSTRDMRICSLEPAWFESIGATWLCNDASAISKVHKLQYEVWSMRFPKSTGTTGDSWPWQKLSRSLWCWMQNKKSTTTTWGTDSQLTLWPRQALLAAKYVTGSGGHTETPSNPISIVLPVSTVPTCRNDKA